MMIEANNITRILPFGVSLLFLNARNNPSNANNEKIALQVIVSFSHIIGQSKPPLLTSWYIEIPCGITLNVTSNAEIIRILFNLIVVLTGILG